MTQLRWFLTALLAAYACQLAVHHATPIDRALPFVAVIVTFVAALSYPALMIEVPLLIAAEIAIPDEGTRLLAFGAIVAGVFAVALIGKRNVGGDAVAANDMCRESAPHPPFASLRAPSPHRGEAAVGRGLLNGGSGETQSEGRMRGQLSRNTGLSLALTCGAILLLRWIPFSDVQLGRELFLLVIASLIVLVLDRTPFAIALAVIVVLITPAIPLRTLLLPLAVLFVAVLARVFGMPKVTLTWLSAIALAFVMLFFSWSGVVARAFPYFLLRARPEVPRQVVAEALPAKATLMLDVPDGATSIIVSGANVSRMTRGTSLGTVGSQTIRIGDASDWGYLRRDYFYGSRNPLPIDPAGRLRGYGYSAWVDGAGRVALPPHVRRIRITADAALPPGASLQVEGFE